MSTANEGLRAVASPQKASLRAAASAPRAERAAALAVFVAGSVAVALALASIASCGGASTDARYPERHAGCAVKSFPGEPAVPVDDLGTVTVDCAAGGGCSRQVLDAVCARGGDIAWGLGDNALTAAHVVAHAAHTKRATQGPNQRGCPVQVFADAPSIPTENIGPIVATCDQDDSKDVCLRELQDQACLLGGDVVWQIEGPTPEGNKQRMRGRVAHSR